MTQLGHLQKQWVLSCRYAAQVPWCRGAAHPLPEVASCYPATLLHYVTGSRVKTPPGSTGTLAAGLKEFIPSSGHIWVNCADVRAKRDPQSAHDPQHWIIPCRTAHSGGYSGVPTQPEHTLTHYTLCFVGFSQPQWIKTTIIVLTNKQRNCNNCLVTGSMGGHFIRFYPFFEN